MRRSLLLRGCSGRWNGCWTIVLVSLFARMDRHGVFALRGVLLGAFILRWESTATRS